MRVTALLLLAALLAGCGGSVREPGAAALAPRDAIAVVEVDADAARELLGERKAAELEGLGDRIVVVVLDLEDYVVLTRPDDPKRVQELGATREAEGWTAAARSDAVLDRYETALARGRLEPQDFPADALATLHAPGRLALALTLETDRVRVSGSRLGDAEPGAVPADLLDAAPADALAVIAFGAGLDARPYVEPLTGGGALWARPGLLFPEVSLLLEEAGDAERALDGLPPGLRGLVRRGEVDGRTLLTTGPSLETLGGFERPEGLPDELTAFLWVDLERAFPRLGLGTVVAYSDGREIGGFVEMTQSR